MIMAGAALATGAGAASAQAPAIPAPVPPALKPTGKLRALYDRSIVIDGLSGPASTNVPLPAIGPLTPDQVANAKASGITAINVTVSRDGYAGSVKTIAFWLKEIDRHPDVYMNVRSHADLLRAKAQKKVGLIFGFQGADPIGDDIKLLDVFDGLGVKIIQLTYNDRNRLGDGSLVPENQGLTPFGREVVARLNELRIVVDLSHAGTQTAYEGLMASKRPPVISHTGCRAVYDHPRNQTDKVLKACADQGGVAGMFLMPFLGGDPIYPTRGLLLKHIDHALQVCGEDHVGIGSDLSINPISATPEYMRAVLETQAQRKARGISTAREDMPVFTPQLNSPRRLELIAEGMDQAGRPTRIIEKVIGGNFDRVFREVWGA
jgi:membrane dipeptidase